MSADDNKQLMMAAFAELAQGNSTHLRKLIAEDCRWNLIGTTPWSGANVGKQAIENFLASVDDRFTGPVVLTADRFIAEGDYMAVQFHGQATTTEGRPYNNVYCWVCHMSDGQLREITEYADTQLAMTTLFAPSTQ
ncbi:nuclear transport factor 2 family protein [Nocardia altamirensis]|uniref:nuclear transport factor 2 family protein n=1 Tax=Nocardia altamirensis TaxID=472158 RepID=UPI0008406BA0|nr:nuclear transport factor 2 family protein [Nocardia altamirensis]